MSWLCSRALVEAFSAATSSDGAPYALSSSSPTPQAFLSPDKMTEFSRPSRSGMTFGPLTDDLGAALLTWFLGDSRVRTYQLPGMAPESTVSDQGSGEKWHESSVRYDRDSSSWRTHRSLFEEDLPWSSVTLPSWGMTLDGVLWEPPTSGRPISGTASGSLPTPRASMGKHGIAWCRARIGEHRHNLEDFLATQWLQEGGEEVSGLNAHPEFIEWVMGFPSKWTDLSALEMLKFHEWQRQHSLISRLNGSEEAA